MKLLLYCTKGKPYLYKFDKEYILEDKQFWNDSLNGKIVAECDFEVEEIKFYHIHERDDLGILHNERWWEYQGLNIGNYKCELSEKSCLDSDKIMDYLCNDKGYAIHIKNLHIFDEPKELSDYYNRVPMMCSDKRSITSAPQNMRYAEDYFGHKRVLISIHPEWLCKILNGEKTIEVRKKVLKEML